MASPEKRSELRNPRLWVAVGVVTLVLLWSPVKELFQGANSVIEKTQPPKPTHQAKATNPPTHVAEAVQPQSKAEPQSKPQPQRKPQSQSKPQSQIAKKDGTIDARPDDLDELCKDWVYYRTKILKFTREGNQKAASEARRAFADVNTWLSEYRDNDVATTCAKYDTPEFIRRYL